MYNNPTMSKFAMQRFTRRQALQVLGAGATCAIQGRAQAPAFPKGAIIRTVLKDYAPEDLAGGATLFHEHMQLAPDFNAKFGAATAAARAANGLPPAPARGGGPGRAAGPPPCPDRKHGGDLMTPGGKKARAGGRNACIGEAGDP